MSSRSQLSDVNYLQKHQYRTADNLSARMNLHNLFSTNPYGCWSWVLDQLIFEPGWRVLEAGCGSGELWSRIKAQMPEKMTVVLSDFSPGMVCTTRGRLVDDPRFRYLTADVQSLPLRGGVYDAALANHMLYHAPDLPQAIRELARMLCPGGRLYATTIGMGHMSELDELILKVNPSYRNLANERVVQRFSLENGCEILSSHFDQLEVRRYEDSLWVTEAQPLVDYTLSYNTKDMYVGDRIRSFQELVESRIRSDGGIRIHKESGMILGMVK